MGTAEDAREKANKWRAEREAEKAAEIAVWADDAQAAWDAGRTFLLPTIWLMAGKLEMSRAKDAELILEAITAVGWHLHTWTAGAEGPAGITYARPLFVREP